MRLSGERSPLAMQRPTSEAELVDRAREGDLEALDELVRRHLARVHALLFRMIGNHEDAEDLAQECFVRAQRSLGWYRGDASFSTWLYRISLSLVRDHFRARGRGARGVSLAEDELALPRGARAPEDEAARRELLGGLRRGLDRLPHRLRAALLMRTQEGLEYEEIGRVLGITPATARTCVMKARRRLERWLRPWTEGRERR